MDRKDLPDGAADRLNRAMSAAMRGSPADALPIFEDVLREHPDFAPAHVNLAHTLDILGRGKESGEHYRKAVALEPDGTLPLCGLSRWHVKRGDFAEAAELAGRALENGRHIVALWAMGDAMAEMGNYAEAAEYYKEAAAADPGDAHFQSRAADMLVLLDRNEEALPYMRAAAAAEPSNAGRRLKMGILCSRLDMDEEAAEEFAACVRLDPSDRSAHANLGVSLGRLGKLEQSIHWLREALRIDPEYAHAHSVLSAMLRAAGDHDAASEHMRAAEKIDPRYIDDPSGGHMRGRAAVESALGYGARKAGKPRRPARTARKPR